MVKVSVFLQKTAELHNIDLQYPVPEYPEGGHSYRFPMNADRLSDGQIEEWLLFFGAWRGYLSHKIAGLDSQHTILSEGFDVMLSIKIAELEKQSDKRLLKDSLKGLALSEDDQLESLRVRVIGLSAELILLKGRLSLYESQFETISRLVTRRGQERFKI